MQFRTEREGFQPYLRDDKLVRPWAIPGVPGLEHRIGGLEKENISGNISYDAHNHELMCRIRAERVEKIADDAAADRSPRRRIAASCSSSAGAARTARSAPASNACARAATASATCSCAT